MIEYVTRATDVILLLLGQHTLRATRSQCIKVYDNANLCEFAGITLGHLKSRRESKYEGIIHPCDQFEFAGITPGHLKSHRESKHEGIIYPCDQCEFASTHPTNLKRHKADKHEGNIHHCDQCEYFAQNLKRHKKSKHFQVSFWKQAV